MNPEGELSRCHNYFYVPIAIRDVTTLLIAELGARFQATSPCGTAPAMPVQIRRSRMRRARLGKRIEISPRDIAIFKLLSRYRFLNSNFIHAFVGGASETRFKERMTDLFHEGYLGRPEKQWEIGQSLCRPIVYEAGARSRTALHEHGGQLEPRVTWIGNGAHCQFAHGLMTCDLLASIELGTRRASHVRFIPWSEILEKAPVATREASAPNRIPYAGGSLIPDGLFGLEYTIEARKLFRFFALEVDRGTMPIARSRGAGTSYCAKLEAYQQLLRQAVHRTHLGLPNLLVLTLTSTEHRKQEIMRKAPANMEFAASFLFKVLPPSLSAPQTALMSGPWERVGYGALCIDRP